MAETRQLAFTFASTRRKRRSRRGGGTPHRARPAHCHRHPVHVTLRRARFLPSVREPAVFSALRRALAASSRRWFRVVHFSFQENHAHMIVEADDAPCLSRGMTGLTVRLARAFNRIVGRRGCVWSHRFHGRALKTPREVRNCLVYVLFNHRKHAVRDAPLRGADPCSSARWFNDWKKPSTGPPRAFVQRDDASQPTPVMPPRTWLTRTGWMRHGRIGMSEMPKGAR
jgi:putative transposase